MILAAQGKVKLHTSKYKLTDFQKAIDDLSAGKVRGRAILVRRRRSNSIRQPLTCNPPGPVDQLYQSKAAVTEHIEMLYCKAQSHPASRSRFHLSSAHRRLPRMPQPPCFTSY